jgi:hypothetical protein
VEAVFRCFFLCLDPAFTTGLDTYKARVTESNLYSSIRTWRFTLVSISSEDRFQNLSCEGHPAIWQPEGFLTKWKRSWYQHDNSSKQKQYGDETKSPLHPCGSPVDFTSARPPTLTFGSAPSTTTVELLRPNSSRRPTASLRRGTGSLKETVSSPTFYHFPNFSLVHVYIVMILSRSSLLENVAHHAAHAAWSSQSSD